MMPRVLKFRAWDGHQIVHPVDLSQGGGLEWLGVYDWPLMQFTGLKDKNGKEIYEGDIVCAIRTPDQPISGGYLGIKADNKSPEYRLVDFKITDTKISFELPKDISYSERIPGNELQWEVVGDIYTTPELLK